VERVEGAFAAVESVMDAAVEREVFEDVRRADAARRGRGADRFVLEVLVIPWAALLLLIRAASAFREGIRLAGLEASGAGIIAGVVFELIVVVKSGHGSPSATLCNHFSISGHRLPVH